MVRVIRPTRGRAATHFASTDKSISLSVTIRRDISIRYHWSTCAPSPDGPGDVSCPVTEAGRADISHVCASCFDDPLCRETSVPRPAAACCWSVGGSRYQCEPDHLGRRRWIRGL